jgi:hypothetical protein
MAQIKGGAQPPYLANPPQLPSIEGVNTRLVDYLRRFSLWTVTNFNSTVQKRSATGELYVKSTTGNTVWALTLDDSGRLQTTQILPGSPTSVGTTLTFAPIAKYGSSTNYNPTGSASTTYVMMGLALSLAPEVATGAWITADGQITNSANNGETDVVVCYGTGTAPANGAAQTGTIVGQPARYKSTAANDFVPFSLTSLITGLTSGTTYWIDLAVKAVGGGTARVMDLDFNAHGLA